MKEKRTFKEYWKDSWNLFSLLYLAITLIIYVSLMLIINYAAKKGWIDSITFSSIVIFSINGFVLLFRWGFAKGIINAIVKSHDERKIYKLAKQQFDSTTSVNEQNAIIARQREKYNRDKELKEYRKTHMTNLVFYILVLLPIVAILCMIPWLVK